MALFGKKKQNDEDINTEEFEETVDVEEEAEDEVDEAEAEKTAPEDDESGMTAEEIFQRRLVVLAQRMRVMFPQQMLIGFYYAELQSEGYIDDFCCYTLKGELLERSEIPGKTGMSLPDMVSREERLEQAFFRFRKAAEEFTKKSCNAVSLTMLNNGQVKIDITSEPLVEGEEDIRYGKWRDMVEKTELRPAPRKIPQEKLDEIQKQAQEYYQALGTEFFSFLPEEDYKIAYFYAEYNENGVFYYNRMIMNDGEIIDGDDMFERFDMDADEAKNNRVEVIKQLMNVRKVFTDNGEAPFTNVTLSVTAKGEFSSNMAFNPVSADTEQQRLEAWKEAHKE